MKESSYDILKENGVQEGLYIFIKSLTFTTCLSYLFILVITRIIDVCEVVTHK